MVPHRLGNFQTNIGRLEGSFMSLKNDSFARSKRGIYGGNSNYQWDCRTFPGSLAALGRHQLFQDCGKWLLHPKSKRFFPLFPLLGRFVGWLVGGNYLAGLMLVLNISLLLGLILL
jgi:hypothetical protein